MPLGVSRDLCEHFSEPLVTTPVLRLVSDTGVAVRHTRLAGGIDGAFYRHMVAGMRNGVLAITRDGALALINDEALRIFGLAQNDAWLGQPFAKAFEQHPDVVRVLISAFALDLLPNRAEMRLKPTGTVIGYTLGHVRDDRGQVIGAAMYFKDLTRVEQLVERERLRDRLVAVGELAAVFAHEVKNPLAGIEVAAGLLRRRVSSSPEAQQLLSRHHGGRQDGQRHRPGSAGLRAADPAAGGHHGARGSRWCRHPAGRHHWTGAARSRWTWTFRRRCRAFRPTGTA